jgi:hypothetical protein
MSAQKDNPAQIRGDIQQGRSGDKRHGFDPAMAPLETDSEAGGVPLTPEQIAISRETQAQGKPDRSMPEYSSAMRPPEPTAEHASRQPSLWVVVVFSVVVALVALTIFGLIEP